VLLVALAAIGLGALVAMSFVSRATAKTYTCDALVPEPPGEIPAQGVEQPDFGNAHVAPGSVVDYALCPPTSGAHYNAAGQGPLRPGFYRPAERATPGGWVHNLEHGFIVVLYRGEPDSAAMAQLQAFSDAFPVPAPVSGCTYKKLVIARFDDMSTPFAVLGWRHLLQLPEWDAGRAQTFASTWLERTPTPEATIC
jgi:hypothetical protein